MVKSMPLTLPFMSQALVALVDENLELIKMAVPTEMMRAQLQTVSR